MQARIRRFARFSAAAAIATIASMTGCSHVQTEGGSQASKDQHTFMSAPWQPKTVSLVDTTSDEILWTYEVPVGKKLVIRFHNGKNALAEQKMTWGVGEPDEKVDLDNEMPVPSQTVRKLTWELRPVPEYASTEADAGEGG